MNLTGAAYLAGPAALLCVLPSPACSLNTRERVTRA